MSSVSISILGLDEILQSPLINPTRLTAAIKEDIGKATLRLHQTLSKAVTSKFTAQNDINKRLVGNSIHLKTFGANRIRGGLEYSIKYSDVSKFSYTMAWGNINTRAKSEGVVHTSNVVTGKHRVVYGGKKQQAAKSGRGGFTPRRGGSAKTGTFGETMRFGSHGAQMFMRLSSKKRPLKLLLAPSTATMIYWALSNDANVRNEIDTLENRLLENYF